MDAHDIGRRQQLVKAIVILLLVLSAVLCEDAFAESGHKLQLAPENCIALNEGQTCFQTVTVSWQSPAPSDYCLYDNTQNQSLVCWQNVRQGQVRIDFASDTSITYRLVSQVRNDEEPIEVARSTLVVSWVYSKSKKRRNSWRLF